MDTKQVIVVRKDLNMRKGKLAAQVSHASMAFLTRSMSPVWITKKEGDAYFRTEILKETKEIEHWLKSSFAKIVVYVNSEEELLEVYNKAQSKHLMAHLITDSGKTEFGGIPTNTCVGIGPHSIERFEGITDHLPLL